MEVPSSKSSTVLAHLLHVFISHVSLNTTHHHQRKHNSNIQEYIVQFPYSNYSLPSTSIPISQTPNHPSLARGNPPYRPRLGRYIYKGLKNLILVRIRSLTIKRKGEREKKKQDSRSYITHSLFAKEGYQSP